MEDIDNFVDAAGDTEGKLHLQECDNVSMTSDEHKMEKIIAQEQEHLNMITEEEKRMFAEIDEQNKQDQGDKTIFKIVTAEDFVTVCADLRKLHEQPDKAVVRDKNTLKRQLEIWMRKQVVDLTQKSHKEKKEAARQKIIADILNVMKLIDSRLPWAEFFQEHGLELLAIFFKLTYFGNDIDNSVCNLSDLKEHLRSG